MQRRVTIWVDVPVEAAADAARTTLHVAGDSDGALLGELASTIDPPPRLSVRCEPRGTGGTQVELSATSRSPVPVIGRILDLLVALDARRQLGHAGNAVRAVIEGTTVPPAPKPIAALPPVPFTADQTRRIAAVAAAAAAASFCGALLTQNGDAAADSFHRGNGALGLSLAVVRVGVLVSLVAAWLADRYGRRRTLLVCLAGAALANGVTAAAPTWETFTAAQVLTRAFTNAVFVIAGIAAVEEAPEGARAFALSMFAFAFGVGFAAAVVLLPLADLGDDGWRITFAISALVVLLVPVLARWIRETVRFERSVRLSLRETVRELVDRRYGRRLLLLGGAAFLTNFFSAPSSQLTNRYLRGSHDFSHADIALFRGITAGIPGLIGVLLGGRLSESRGRRPVIVAGLVVATLFQAAFFLAGGIVLWIVPMIAIVAALAGGLALGALDAELFPTSARGASNGFLLVCAVAGSAGGLLLATQLDDLVGGLGPAIALCGAAPLFAALVIAPRLPETARQKLDDVSPYDPV